MKTLLISAGHSSSDPGAISGGCKESELALELRDLIVKELGSFNIKALTD